MASILFASELSHRKMYNFTFPVSFWKNKKNQLNFLNYIKEFLHFKTYEDWYQLRTDDIQKFGGNRLLGLYDGYLLDVQI